MADKWKLVEGKVYRLLETFVEGKDAVARAREAKEENYVFISKENDGTWAVYYRPRLSDFDEEALE